MVDQTPFRDANEDFANAGRLLTGRAVLFDSFNREDGLLSDAETGGRMTCGPSWVVTGPGAGPGTDVYLEDGLVNWHESNDLSGMYLFSPAVGQSFATTYDEIAVEVVWQPGETGASALIFGSSQEVTISPAALYPACAGVYFEVIPGVPTDPNDPDDILTGTLNIYVNDGDDPLADAITTELYLPIVADGKTRTRYSMARVAEETLMFSWGNTGSQTASFVNVATNKINDVWGPTVVVGWTQPTATYPTDRTAAISGISTGASVRAWPTTPDDLAPTNIGNEVADVAGVFTFTPNTYDYEEAQVLVNSTSTSLANGEFYGQQYTLSAVATGTNKTFEWPANTIFTSVAPILGKVIGDRMSVTFRWNEVDWIEVSRAGGDSRLEGHAIADAAGVFTYLPNSYISETAALLVDSTSNTLPDGTYFGQEYTLSVVATGTAKTYVWPTNTVFTSAAPVAGLVIGDRMSVTFRWNTVDWVEVSRASSTKPRLKALTDGANIATNALLGDTFTVTLGGDRTMDNPTNPRAGQEITYAIRQDGTAPRLITWGAAFRFSGGTAPTLTNANNKTDYVSFLYNGTDSKWDCVSTALNF